MMFDKLAVARAILRHLHEKQAGVGVPLAAGVALAAGAHGVGKAVNKSREYRAGFVPGGLAHGSQE